MILKEKLLQEILVPHGESVTSVILIAWRERFEAELALERAKLMPESTPNIIKGEEAYRKAMSNIAALRWPWHLNSLSVRAVRWVGTHQINGQIRWYDFTNWLTVRRQQETGTWGAESWG